MKDINKKVFRVVASVAGAAVLLTRAQTLAADVIYAPESASLISNGEENQLNQVHELELETNVKSAAKFNVEAHIKGSFSFDQDVLSPPDQVFSIFGTALTGLCAKPFFAFENDVKEIGQYLVKIGGDIKNAYSVNLADLLKEKQQQKTMLCSCSSGSAIATAKVKGVLIEDVIDIKTLDKDVNTITVYGEDGYGFPMPLNYLIDKKALIVFKVNDNDIPSGNQLWVADTVSKYFTRKITNIELKKEDNVPQISKAHDEQRAKIKIMNSAKNLTFKVGQQITFEGYADDLGVPITAIEFSMDDGVTWTSFDTKAASTDKWVYWYFSYVPENAGTYQLTARARTSEGRVSELVSAFVFNVDAVKTIQSA